MNPEENNYELVCNILNIIYFIQNQQNMRYQNKCHNMLNLIDIKTKKI